MAQGDLLPLLAYRDDLVTSRVESNQCKGVRERRRINHHENSVIYWYPHRLSTVIIMHQNDIYIDATERTDQDLFLNGVYYWPVYRWL